MHDLEGKTATTTINVSLGWSRVGVAGRARDLGRVERHDHGQLHVAEAARRKAATAYAVGRDYSYKIQKTTTLPTWTTITKSGTLHAFSAYSNQISCR